MKPNGLVVDEEVFSALSAECEKIIDTRKRLPDFVFRRSFPRYFAIEYAHIYRKEFAVFLFELSKIFGDESVNYTTLDPSPDDSGYRQRSYFGLAWSKDKTGTYLSLKLEGEWSATFGRSEYRRILGFFQRFRAT
jgi:hypothetical protein